MHTTTKAFDLLYLSRGAPDHEAVTDRLEKEGWDVTPAKSLEQVRGLLPGVDCVLVGPGPDTDWQVGLVRTLRTEYPSVPVLAFVDDGVSKVVDALLEAGAGDVVQSPVEETPVSLVRHRVRSLVTADGDGGERFTRYETILNTATDAIYQLDRSGTIVAVNDAAEELTGYDREELVGMDVSTFISADDMTEGERIIREQLEGDGHDVRRLNVRVETADGETVPCETRIGVIRVDGEFAGTVGVVRDKRQQLAREQQLRDRDELLRQISEAVTDVVWVTTPDKDEIEFVSAAYEEIWGRSREELYADSHAFVEAVHPEDRERVREALVRQQVKPETYDETFRVVRPDDEIRWVNDRAFGVYEDGELVRIVGVTQDITERKQAEQELEAERDMFAQGPAVVFRWENEPGWPVEYVSENVTDLLGYTPEQLESGEVPFADIIHEDDLDRVSEEVDDNSDASTERFSHDPYRVVTADGGVRWVRDTTTVIREGGAITGYLGYLVDVTERKRREAELEAERDLVERILETSPVGIGVIDEEGAIEAANDRAADILGVENEGLLTRNFDDPVWTVRDGDGDVIPTDEFPPAQVFETGEPVYDWVAEVERPDGEAVWVSFNAAPMFAASADVSRVVLTLEDITEHVQREGKIERQRNELAQLDRLNAVIREVDQGLVGAETRREVEQTVCERLTESGQYEFAVALRVGAADRIDASAWTEVGAEYVESAFPVDVGKPDSPALRAVDTGEVEMLQSLGDQTPSAEWQTVAQRLGIESLAAIPITHGDRTYGVVAVYDDDPAAFGERELDVLGELGETVGYAIAAVERREREETLTSLYEATQDLLGVETRQGVAEVVVRAAEEVLDIPGVGVLLFDEEENALKPVAATETLLEYYGEATPLRPGENDAETWYSYVTGERRFFEDIRESDRVVDPETDARATLIIPLGDHGVFVAAAGERDAFDEQKRRLVGLLAATTEAALDRVAGQADIRERDAELAARTERVTQLEHILSCMRDIDDLLVRSGTREEIESGVCERITETDPYTFAWIGTVPPDSDSVVPQTWSGPGESYLDEVSLTLTGTEPTARTAAEGSLTVVETVRDQLRETAWARAAIDNGFQSVLAVPLVYGETTYGVLGVYAEKLDAFDDTVRSVFAEVGQMVAYGINTVETRRGVLSERVTELELSIREPGAFLNAVARVAGGPVSYREILPESADTTSVLFALSDPNVDEILALESEYLSVESLRHIDRGDEHLFRATLTGQTVAGTLLTCGGIPQEVTATDDETTAVVHLPEQLDVRVYLDRVRVSFPETSLVSRRSVDRRQDDRVEIRAALDQRLTERQREVLLTAFESGFFESPRETTGAELADLLDITQPTVTHHLREAQRRLFATLYGDESRR